MEELVKEINKKFPPKEDGFNCAVFFHHDKDGVLKTLSPLVAPAKNEKLDINLIVKRLLAYSDACKKTAEEMLNKTLPKN